MQRGTAPPAQLLDIGQERVLWEEVLSGFAEAGSDETALSLHAGALMNAAARATQARLSLRQSAQGEEERLLVAALDDIRTLCDRRGLLSLRLAGADDLQFLRETDAPLIAGEQRQSALQEELARRYWPGAALHLPLPQVPPAEPALVRATDLEQELAACAAWCRAQVEREPGARLLVISACADPSPAIQAEMLWRSLTPDAVPDALLRARWLAVEGGEPLMHQALAADALTALALLDPDGAVQMADVLALLRSPYFALGTFAQCASLSRWIGGTGLASLEGASLRAALRHAADHEPAAQHLDKWLAAQDGMASLAMRQGATEWALRFSAALDGLGFARSGQLDSREQQRLVRWHQLLDEFAALDAVLPPMNGGMALQRLRRLAAQARHQPASADAAISFSASLADPLAHYDGIWVLGLAESRWPAPPRPDAWIALGEQRRAGWPEAGVTQRRAQAMWALDCWRRRTTHLVLSHPVREGDLVHRAPALPLPHAQWRDADTGALTPPRTGLGAPDTNQLLPPVTPQQLERPLAGGTGRLGTQQDCPFRAQAWWRLGAQPPSRLGDGVPAPLRGKLLHALLQFLWQRLRDHAALMALDSRAQQELLQESWVAALRAVPESQWLEANAREREHQRTLQVIGAVLELERHRTPFAVRQQEQDLRWQGAGATLTLRIDRIDSVAGEAVLIDYKSGAAARTELHAGRLQPLQLALYAAALAQQGTPVGAAALLNLDPAGPGFAGIASRTELLGEDLPLAEDWPGLQQQWQQELLQLMTQHLAGDATLTRDRRLCARCHLPALCRRAGAEAAESDDE